MNTEQIDDNGLEKIDDAAAMAEIQKAFDKIDALAEQDSSKEKDAPIIEEEVSEKETQLLPEEEVEETEEDNEAIIDEDIEIEAPQKMKKGDKYRKLQNDKYRAIAEKEAMAARVNQLEEMLKDSLNSGTYHYGKNVYGDLERARAKKAYAYEQGDTKLAVEADEELIKAMYAVNDLEKWTSQLDRDKNNNTPQNAQQPTTTNVEQELVMDWFDSHPYLKSTSKKYDAKLTQKVGEFADRLDYNLSRKGQSHLIYSEAYFNKLDNYIDSLTKKPVDVAKNIESHKGVSGVRGSMPANQSASGRRPTQIVLNANEKQMALNMGISEKDWLKYKLENRG